MRKNLQSQTLCASAPLREKIGEQCNPVNPVNPVEKITDLIRRTSSDLPPDVEGALTRAATEAPPGSQAAFFLNSILENIRIAREQGTPLCQDTGGLTFFWRVPPGTDTPPLEHATREAVRIATENGWLRQNTVDSLTGAPLPEGGGCVISSKLRPPPLC